MTIAARSAVQIDGGVVCRRGALDADVVQPNAADVGRAILFDNEIAALVIGALRQAEARIDREPARRGHA